MHSMILYTVMPTFLPSANRAHASQAPLRIAVITFSSSGLFHYAANLVQALAEQSNLSILFLTSFHNDLSLLKAHPRLTVTAFQAPHTLPAFFAWCLNLREQFRLWSTIRAFRPDVIHIADSYAIYVPHWPWLKLYPIVFTQHDPLTHAGDVFRFSSRLIHKTQQNLSQAIVVHGQYLRNIVVGDQGVAAGRVHVIPHGEYGFFRQWQNPNLKKIPRSVLLFGRMYPYKGLDTLLQSLKILERRGRPVRLILAGSGDLTPYRARLASLDQPLIENRFIKDQEVISYFQQAEAVVLPYKEASQSGIIPIAFPAGVPVIATRVGALPEILQHEKNALLVEPDQPLQLADAIERVLQDPILRATLIQGGKTTAETRLAWPAIARQYRHIYESVK